MCLRRETFPFFFFLFFWERRLKRLSINLALEGLTCTFPGTPRFPWFLSEVAARLNFNQGSPLPWFRNGLIKFREETLSVFKQKPSPGLCGTNMEWRKLAFIVREGIMRSLDERREEIWNGKQAEPHLGKALRLFFSAQWDDDKAGKSAARPLVRWKQMSHRLETHTVNLHDFCTVIP